MLFAAISIFFFSSSQTFSSRFSRLMTSKMPSLSFSNSEYRCCKDSVFSSAVGSADRDGTGGGGGGGGGGRGRGLGFDDDGRTSGIDDGKTSGTGFVDFEAEISEAGFSLESSPNWDETRAERLSLGVELFLFLIVAVENEWTEDESPSLVVSPTRRASKKISLESSAMLSASTEADGGNGFIFVVGPPVTE